MAGPTRRGGRSVTGVLIGAVVVLLWTARPAGVTQFAAGYTRAGIAGLRPGDPVERVLEVLGRPLVVSRGPDEVEYWSYSTALAPQHMVVRVVVVDSRGRVRQVRRQTNWDYVAHLLSGGGLAGP